MQEESVGQFFSSAWQVYEKVVAGDYLSHRLLYQGINDFLDTYDEPIRFLELGCGDARLSLDLLRDRRVEAYLGIDSSIHALELARRRSAGRPGHWRLLQGDVRHMPEVGQDWNVALASFCLHHLSSQEKRRTLASVRAALRAPAVFLLIDVFRQEGQDREAYLQRRRTVQRESWKALDDQEIELVIQHESAADFPETVSDYRKWALEAGFTSAQDTLAAPDGTHRWLSLTC